MHKLRENYLALGQRYQQQLGLFINETQKLAMECGKVGNTIVLPGPSNRGMLTLHFTLGYIKRNGIRHFLFKAKHFIRSNGLANVLRNTIRNVAGGA